MGVFSALGSFFGPVGTAVGAGVDMATADDGDGGTSYEQQVAASNMASDREYARQKEFATMGIRWKAADAAFAGLHPLAVIGGQGASYSPTIALPAGTPSSRGSRYNTDSLGSAVADLAGSGQNTARAQVATETPAEREMTALAIRNAELRNALLEGQVTAQWASIMGQPGNPAMSSGVGSSVAPRRSIKLVPSQQTSARSDDPGLEAASTPGFKNFNVVPGVSIDLPGQQMSESLESYGPMAGPAVGTFRGLHRKLFGPEMPKNLPPAPAGQRWSWSVRNQSWNLEPLPKSAPWSSYRSGRGNARVR